MFQDAHVKSEILTYPADHNTSYWTNAMWEEWFCKEATLDILADEPVRLCDFQAEKMSIIQRSIATPKEGVTAPIIWLENGDDEANYLNLNFEGALVFSDGDWNKVRSWAVEKRGAIGIISERMVEFPIVRHRFDIPDAILYTSFWWTNFEKRCFGFALSPKQGDWLKKLCIKQKALHQADQQLPAYVTAKAFVDAKLYPGTIENVNAFIPGTTREEVIITAHLCHPQASANDNASGVAVAIEMARTLQKLIEEGKLAKPKRGIRFLLIPEMTGTYAYLSQNESKIPKILAGLNLDMVGEKQELCQGPLVVEYPPQAAKSFVGDLMAGVLEAVTEEAKNLAGNTSYALFKYTVSPFSGGSDHYVLSDPTVGIPSPMLIQWPDKFYHTSADTLDKVDPQMLYRVGCMSATYAYLLASMDHQDMNWVLPLSRTSYINHINNLLKLDMATAVHQNQEEKSSSFQKTKALVLHLLSLKEAEMSDLARFMTTGKLQLNAAIKRQVKIMTDYTQMMIKEQRIALELDQANPAESQSDSIEDGQKIPVRLFRGPFNARGTVEKMPLAVQKSYKSLLNEYPTLRSCSNQLLYWTDGDKTTSEVIRLTQLETGIDCKISAPKYFQVLHEMNLISWKE
jgi:aminopeptidase-like protein